jgi:hypothetical protein
MRSVSSAGVTAIVEWDCCECSKPVVVKYLRAGFASDEDAGAGVPGLVAEHDADVQ